MAASSLHVISSDCIMCGRPSTGKGLLRIVQFSNLFVHNFSCRYFSCCHAKFICLTSMGNLFLLSVKLKAKYNFARLPFMSRGGGI
jgi:hypothetical protein